MSLSKWNLPPGVDPGTWDYVTSKSIAQQYESYFQDHPLFAIDQGIVRQALGSANGQSVADYGCGTGRALFPLIEDGFRGIAVDLSREMLKQVRRNGLEKQLPVTCIQANMVQLDAIADQSIDHGICLFSTLGMVKGRQNRRSALKGIARVTRAGGTFVLHIHNYWYNLRDPGGPWWLVKNRLQSWFRSSVERGDKHYPYRGLSNMFLHVFTAKEIRDDLQAGGWEIRHWHALEPGSLKPREKSVLFPSLRTVGWVIICRKPAR